MVDGCKCQSTNLEHLQNAAVAKIAQARLKGFVKENLP